MTTTSMPLCFLNAVRRYQASRRNRSGINNPIAYDSEHTISVPVSEKLPYLRDLFTSAAPPFQGRHPTSHSQSGRETLSRFRPVLPLRSPSPR